MFCISYQQGNANQDNSETSPPTKWDLHTLWTMEITSVGMYIGEIGSQSFLVGMLIGPVFFRKLYEHFLKTRHCQEVNPAISLFSICTKNPRILFRKRLLFSTTLFTAAKFWKYPQCPRTDNWSWCLDKETLLPIHNPILLSYKKR